MVIAENRSKSELSHQESDKRQGIALVVVLGFLAVLTIMAVGMAISMRTERLASRSYMDMVKARLYCEAGLADSMSFLDEITTAPGLSSANLFMPNFMRYLNATEQEQLLPPGKWPAGYFKQSVISSIDTFIGDEDADVFTNSLINGLGRNFLPYMPGRFYRAMYAEEDAYGTELMQGRAQWKHTTETLTDGSVVTNGRYMYIILNTTAQIDINYLDRPVEPSGFKIYGNNGLFINSGNYSSFLDELANDTRYETTRDINESNSSIAAKDEDDQGAWYQYGAAPSYVIPYSYYPPMRRVEIGDGRIELGPRPAFLSTNYSEWFESDIIVAFDEAIKDAPWKNADGACSSEDLYNLLVDYADDDFKPRSPNAPSIEPVPMINEFMVVSNKVSVEVWAPFVGPPESRYMGEFELRGSVDGVDFNTTARLPNWATDVKPPDPMRIDVNLPATPSNSQFRVEFQVRGDGVVLDRVTRENVAPDESWQCNDPRFNHLDSQWESADETLGEINKDVADYKDNPNSGDYVRDGDYLMYCANRSLRCTGELGYLPVAPWRTLKLYEDSRTARDDMDPVLDYFTMFPTNKPMYGLMCPNGQAPGHAVPPQMVLSWRNSEGAGYFGHYIDEGFRIHETPGENYDRNFLSKNGIFRGFYKEHCSLVRLANISDLGKYLYTMPENPNWPHNYLRFKADVVKTYKPKQKYNVQYSELRLEHAMRRFSALSHVRQSHYVVLLWAQALGDKPSGTGKHSYEIKSEAQAVALVWRDPYPVSNDNQHHRKFVRYMRWME